jgi:Putative transposase DNA-binding domain
MKATEALKSVEERHKQGKRVSCPQSELCPIRYDARSYWVKLEAGIVSLATVCGRASISFHLPPCYRQYLTWRTCSADLCYNPLKKRFYLFLHYKAERKGVLVVSVDPRNSSRTCHQCGFCANWCYIPKVQSLEPQEPELFRLPVLRLCGQRRLQRRSQSTPAGYIFAGKADVSQPILADCHAARRRTSHPPYSVNAVSEAATRRREGGLSSSEQRGTTASYKHPAFTRGALTILSSPGRNAHLCV